MVHQRRPYVILGWNPNVDIASSVLAVDNSQGGDLHHPGDAEFRRDSTTRQPVHNQIKS